jgi:hypothetical protein
MRPEVVARRTFRYRLQVDRLDVAAVVRQMRATEEMRRREPKQPDDRTDQDAPEEAESPNPTSLDAARSTQVSGYRAASPYPRPYEVNRRSRTTCGAFRVVVSTSRGVARLSCLPRCSRHK